MALFTKRKDNGERELTELRKRRSMLEAKFAATDRDLAQALEDRRRALLESDLDAPAAEPVMISRLRDEKDALADAISRIDAKIVDAERQLSEARDRTAREKEAGERRGQIEAAHAAARDFAASGERVVAMLQPLAPVSLAAGAAASNVKYLTDQLGLGIAAGLAEAASYVARVAGGTVAIVAAPIVREAPPPAPKIVDRLEIMVWQHSKWLENGQTMTAAKHAVCRPPRAVAERAISLQLAIRQDSDRYRKLREIDTGEGYGQQWAAVPEQDCTDLETGALPQPQHEESAVTPVEYFGPPLTGVAVAAPARR